MILKTVVDKIIFNAIKALGKKVQILSLFLNSKTPPPPHKVSN